MSDYANQLADSIGLDHIASALATQKSFESAVESAQSGSMVLSACKLVTQEGKLDLSLVLMQGDAEETVGEEYTSRLLKFYNNQYFYTLYHKSLHLSEGFRQEASIRGFDLASKAIQLASKHVRAAQTRLAGLINNGQNAATVRSYVDDTPGLALFAANHLYGATTYSNLNVASFVSVANSIEVNDANLMAGVAAWMLAPDTDGVAGAYNNNLANILLLVSPNLFRTIKRLTENEILLSSAGVPFGPESRGLPWVMVPGLNNNIVVITRKPTDPVAGWYWGMDPWIHSAAKAPDADRSVYKWTYARKWVVAPSGAQASYYLGP